MRVGLLVSTELDEAVGLARDWVADGATVTVVLLDGATAHARAGHARAGVTGALVGEGVTVLAHDAALRRRGIRPAALAEGVKVCDLDEVADLVAEGVDRAVWL